MIFITGCSSPEIEFPRTNQKIVVEGWVTSELKSHWVKVANTVGFTDVRSESPVVDATVQIIRQSDGQAYNLAHDTQGNYFSTPFQGMPGEQYRVQINLSDGRIIDSPFDLMLTDPDLQVIDFSFFLRENPETGEEENVYYPVVTSLDPLNEINFYRYKAYRNDFELNEPDDLELITDRFHNGQILSHNLSRFEYELNDEIKVELQTFGKEAFDFLELLKSQTTSLGSSSGTAPASLIGNLSYRDSDEIVLGFFGTLSVKSDSTIVQ